MAMKRGRGGVEYEDIKVGDGPTADRGVRVEVRYNLFLNRGEQIQENQLYSFRVGKRRVIPGLEYGVEGMRVGGERRLRVAPHLAYQDQAIPGQVPARAVLEFYVTLLRVDRDTEAQ
ncbi:MAG TPA: FKBP-type peptidyl-prolyl cis-trans isomerase [Burkholderiales bacterium]|nr:FKBP-type peptidyl-prolyl cis-trans isomerase [Burkholderiales bacterium]